MVEARCPQRNHAATLWDDNDTRSILAITRRQPAAEATRRSCPLGDGETVAQQPKPLDPARSPRALFGFQLRALREANNLSQQELGAPLFLTKAAIGTYEKGRSLPPSIETVHAFDDALGGHGILAAAYALAVNTPHADTDADSSPQTTRTTPTHGTIGFMNEPADELDRSARDAAEFGAWAERVGTGDVELEVIHQQVRALAVDALTQAPAVIVRRAAPLAKHVYGLARTHQRPRHARELHLLAAQLCSLMAWITGDIGRLDVAELHARTALACAEIAGDPTTTAWAGVVGSKTAFWGQRYEDAADRARRAAAQDARGTVAVMLACQRADAYSQLGDVQRTHSALAFAAEAEQDSHADPVGGLLSCGTARAANYAAAALLAVDEPARALVEAERALRAAVGESLGFGTVAQIHISRALAHAATGDAEAAEEAARPVLGLEPERRLVTLAGRLQRIPAQFPRQAMHSAAARALTEQVEAFCSTAAPARAQLVLPPNPEDSL